MGRWTGWIAAGLVLAACGGGAQGGTGTETATGGQAAPGAVPVAAPEEDSGGIARQGERCDYGGAERYTCTGGLECCYGEHQTPDGYGTCQPECNWD